MKSWKRMRAAEHSMATCLSAHVLFFSAARASLVAHMVKNLPTVQETWVRSLGQDDTLEKEMPRKSYGQRSLVGYSPWDHRDTTESLTLSFWSMTTCVVFKEK